MLMPPPPPPPQPWIVTTAGPPEVRKDPVAADVVDAHVQLPCVAPTPDDAVEPVQAETLPGAFTTKDKDTVADDTPDGSVAPNTKGKVPVEDGVPESTPVDAEKLIPVGREPERDQIDTESPGVNVAARVVGPYAVPDDPTDKDEVVIDGATGRIDSVTGAAALVWPTESETCAV